MWGPSRPRLVVTVEERTVGPRELTAVLSEVFGIELDTEEVAGLVRVHSAVV